MKTDGFSRDRTFMRDQAERSQRHQTRRRRDDQSRRRRIYFACGLGLFLLLLLGAPSLVSHSPAGKGIVSRVAASYGWDARVEGIRIGWITPLRLDGLELRGMAAGTEVSIQQLDTELTVTSLIRSSLTHFGQITARGVTAAVEIGEGRTSLEDDLEIWMSEPSSGDIYTATIHLQDAGLIATDAVSGQAWKFAQANADIEMLAEGISGQFAGVMTEPSGSGGALQGSAAWNTIVAPEAPAWQLRLQCESLPVSVVSLARRRAGEAGSSIPSQISGDSTGRLSVDGLADGRIVVTPERIEIRNVAAADPAWGSKVWANRLATVDGVLVVEPNRVVGRQLKLATDFAAASIDGAFSTMLTLAGTSDNPVLWLDALSGTASGEVDLALLDRALPGMIPLREGVEVVSGKVSARVETLPSDAGVKRSRLMFASQPIRARAAGQGIVVEPIDCEATVINNGGLVAAEKFAWKSPFATATGKGDKRSGAADFEIDFGRLASTLRPIMEIPDNSLAGSARGNVRWNATADNVWRLDGTGQATDVRIVLPSGQTFSRPTLRGDVLAVGRWEGRSLSELSEAGFTINSPGVNLRAELAGAVRAPSPETPMPVRISGKGRVEALIDLVGPWLPPELHDCEGGFDLTARGDVATTNGRITNLAIELTEPRVAYQDRYFSQPSVKVLFDGDYAWPSGDLVSKSFTLAGDAVSAAVQGEMTAKRTNLDVAWRTKLERVQGSVRRRIATRDAGPIQQVGYRPGDAVVSDDWLVMGDVDGKLRIVGEGDWLDLEIHTSGKDLAVLQPPDASAAYQTPGPMPQNRARTQAATPARAPTQSQVVWAEPNFKLDGNVRYSVPSGEIQTTGLDMAGDWFAAKLTGRAVVNAGLESLELQGPGRLKMDEVAKRLTSLTGTAIKATGIHETPLTIAYRQPTNGPSSFSITANLGWESAETAGVIVGPTTIPVRMNETTVFVSPSVVPLAQGQLNIAGEVNYRPGPVWMRVAPGRVAQSVRLTREMNERWLKYIAPLAADAARVEGTLGVTLDEAIVVLDSPEQSRVVGRLDIEGVEMTAGPLSNQIIGGVEQLKSLAQGVLPQAQTDTNKTLVTMPAQTVDFALVDGVVSHQRLFFQIDRAQVITSGRVALDGRLNLVAQIPLDPRWLGRDIQSLAGQSINLPIDGTLSRPSLDSAGVRQVVSQLGTQAIQGAAENYLQQQLNRGIDKIFGN